MDIDVRKLGRYQIAATIGMGPKGTVYKGFDPLRSGFVAIKTVRKDMLFNWKETAELARFRAEARAAEQFSHPNIVAVYEYGEERNIAYIAQEFVDGRTLRRIFDIGERLPLGRALQYLTDLLSALDYAHQREVLHRNLKPENIFVLDQTQRIKVGDFGFGRMERLRLSQAGLEPEISAYRSPEQYHGEEPDQASDVYAAAAIGYNLLSGQPPFKGSPAEVKSKALTQEPPKLTEFDPNLPPALCAVIERAMAKKREDRYQSAIEFLRALEQVLAASPPPPDPTPEANRRRYERRVVVADTVIFREGDPGDAAYLIEKGSMQITKRGGEGEEIVIATAGRGEIVGEMALVDNEPRMATVTAIEDCVLVVVPREEFAFRLEKVDKVTQKLIAVLVQRVRRAGDEVAFLRRLSGFGR